MAQGTPTATDKSAIISGTFTAVGVSADLPLEGVANLTVEGVFAGKVILDVSFDGGQTWRPKSRDASGVPHEYCAPVSVLVQTYEQASRYRVRCAVYRSGTITYRFGR